MATHQPMWIIKPTWLRMALLLLGPILATGCSGTRLPSFVQRSTTVERNAYDFHDPFPLDSIGPETAARPQNFADPKTDVRKAADLQLLRARRPIPNGLPGPTGFVDPRNRAVVTTPGYPLAPPYAHQPNPAPAWPPVGPVATFPSYPNVVR